MLTLKKGKVMSIDQIESPTDSPETTAWASGRAIAGGSALSPDDKFVERSMLQVQAFKSSLPGVQASVQLSAWGGAFSALYSVTVEEAEEIALQLQAAASRVRAMNASFGARRAA